MTVSYVHALKGAMKYRKSEDNSLHTHDRSRDGMLI
jgi:hypothetical protein